MNLSDKLKATAEKNEEAMKNSADHFIKRVIDTDPTFLKFKVYPGVDDDIDQHAMLIQALLRAEMCLPFWAYSSTGFPQNAFEVASLNTSSFGLQFSCMWHVAPG